MTTLLVAAHDNKSLNDATNKALTAVKALDGNAAVMFTQVGGKLTIPTAGLKADPHATVLAIATK